MKCNFNISSQFIISFYDISITNITETCRHSTKRLGNSNVNVHIKLYTYLANINTFGKIVLD